MTRLLMIAWIFCLSLCGQVGFPVTFAIGDASQFGYKQPNFSFNVGIEDQHEKFWYHIWNNYNATNKISYGNVTQESLRGRVYVKNDVGFFAGGGWNHRNIRFHDYKESYWTYGPVVSAGWMQNGFRFRIEAPIYEHDVRYDLRGVSWEMIYDIDGRVRLGLVQEAYKIYNRSNGQNLGLNFRSDFVIGYIF